VAVAINQAQNYAMLINSEAENKTFTRVRYLIFSRANLGFMSLSNAKFSVNRA